MPAKKKTDERRTYETGSFTRISDTKVRLFVSGGTGLGKKRNRFTRTVMAKTDREAERELKKFSQEVAGRSCDGMTLNDLIDEYIELHVAGLSDQSQRWYRDTFRRIRGALGYTKLEDIKPVTIERFYKALANPDHKPFWVEKTKTKGGKAMEKPLKNGLSASTVLHHHRALSAVLKWGYEKEYLAAPVIDRVKTPLGSGQKGRALSDDERARFLLALDSAAQRGAKRFGEDGPAYVAYMSLLGRVALVMGLRRGELCGITWNEVDYPSLHICHSLQAIKGKGLVLGATKTSTSDRWLEMPEDLIVMLQAWRKTQVSHMLKHGLGAPVYVFERLTGGPLDPRHVSVIFTRIFRSEGLDGATLHSLRHTCATHLLAQGVPPNDVAAFLGHSSTKMTLDVYGHAQTKAAAKCAAIAVTLME